MERFLSLYLPEWSIDRIRRSWPKARRRDPLVLTFWRGGAQIVAAASAEARAAGMRSGMSLAHAQALVPNAVIAPHDPAEDIASLELLGRWAVRFSPRVAVDPPDGLLLDITGCERLFRGENNLLERLTSTLTRAGLTAYAAIASTIGTAWAVSHASGELQSIVPPGQSFAALASLSPWALRLDADTTIQLAALGVDRIEILLMLPRSTLPSRFGEMLLRRIDQALGHIHEDITPIGPSTEVSADIRFDGAIHRPEVLQWAVRQLLDRVFEDLERLCCGAIRLELTAHREPDASQQRSVCLCMPSRNRRHVLHLLQSQLERIDLSMGIDVVQLKVAEMRLLMPAQGEFFEQQLNDMERDAAELIDELTGRLGSKRVLQPELIESHRPERAWREQEIQRGIHQQSRHSDGTADVEEIVPARPLRLLPQPCPIEVMAAVPDRPPSWFRYRGQEYLTRGGVGPERLCAEWWNGDGETRDYYQIETQIGARFWVFCETESRRWFLHGVFE